MLHIIQRSSSIESSTHPSLEIKWNGHLVIQHIGIRKKETKMVRHGWIRNVEKALRTVGYANNAQMEGTWAVKVRRGNEIEGILENHEMEEGASGRIQVVYQKRNKDDRTRWSSVQCGSKFPRALIAWNLKFEGRKKERTKRKAKQGKR